MLTGTEKTPKDVLSGLFGPKFLDDPEAIPGLLNSAGIMPGATGGSPGTSGSPASPSASGTPNSANAAPVGGIVPKSFGDWLTDPVNQAKITPQVNNSPLPGMNPPVPWQIARPQADSSASAAPGPAGMPQPAPTSAPIAPAGGPAPVTPVNPPALFPSRQEWLAQNPNAAAIPLPPHQYGVRGTIGMALATLADNMGSALSGINPSVGKNWIEQVQAGREYQRQLPVLTQQAQTAAYEKAQGEAGKTAEIGATQAQTAHVQAETAQLSGGGPFYKPAGDLRNEIETAWRSGGMTPEAFDQWAQTKISGADPRIIRVLGGTNPATGTPQPVGDYLKQVKSMPQQPPQFKIGQSGTIEPIVWRGTNYGAAPSPNEPPEITQARKSALESQQTAEYNKVNPIITAQIGPYPETGTPAQKAAWGQKAQSMTASMSAAPHIIVQQAMQKMNPSALDNVSPGLVKPATEEYAKAGTEYATANQAAKNMSDFITEAKGGNKEAVKMVPLQGALEITTAQGVHRINRTEVDQFGGAGSLFDKIEGHISGAMTGKDIPDQVLNDMQKLQTIVSQNALQLHKNKVAVINKTYGAKFEPMTFPDQQGATSGGNTPEGATHIVKDKTGKRIGTVVNGNYVAD